MHECEEHQGGCTIAQRLSNLGSMGGAVPASSCSLHLTVPASHMPHLLSIGNPGKPKRRSARAQLFVMSLITKRAAHHAKLMAAVALGIGARPLR
jgi:hypothetical protein